MRAVTWIVLLAFALQSFVTQTHIHGFLDSAPTITKVLIEGPSHSNAPIHDDTNNCPFCQAITHAGVFATPCTPSLILPAALVEIAAPTLFTAAIAIVSPHPWQSRAPPHH